MANSGPTPRPSILVVDDDPAIREALAAGLTGAYTVYTAATGAEACAWLDTQSIAVIILDVYLGDENGLALLLRFRALSLARILVLTGRSTEALAIQALRADVDDYVKKPVGLAELRAAVDRLVAPPPSSPPLAAQLRQALDGYPPNMFRAGEVAHEYGVSEQHLRRRFRSAYGQTPSQYLTEVRLQRAASLLRSTDRGIAEIAFDQGFPNVVWFTKRFRRLFGLPPGAYRAASISVASDEACAESPFRGADARID